MINVGGDGIVMADGKEFVLRKMDCVYLGKGTNSVKFKSKSRPALLYALGPAPSYYSNKVMVKEKLPG